MIYLQMGILILEIGLCILLNNLLKNKSKKNTIRHLDNDQEIHLNNITLIGRKDYTNKNQKKTLKIMLTSTQWSHPQRSNVSTIFLLPPTTQLCGQLRKRNIQAPHKNH